MPVQAQIIPLQPVPSQTLKASLSNQPCQINVYAKDLWVPIAPPGTIITDPPAPPSYAPITAIFIELYVNDALVVGAVLARNAVGIVQNTYLGFVGEIAIEDTQGSLDPVWQELGSRFVLTYWTNAT